MEDEDVSSRCAICLCEPDALDVAFIKACLHRFCAPCVARWARFCRARNARVGSSPTDGSDATCPCCKTPFDSVLVYRALDGEASLDGEMIEESLCLLQRAEWVVERRARWEDDAAFATRDDDVDEHDDEEDDDYLDDDDIAFSGRRKTLVLGNRRFGRGGYISNSGRVFARPTGASSSPASGKKKSTAASGKSPVPPATKPPKHTGASSSSRSPEASEPATTTTRSSARSPSPAGSDADGSTPRQRGRKSQKRADAKARKVEQERSRAAARLKRLEDEAAEKEAAREAAKAAREALEVLALERDAQV